MLPHYFGKVTSLLKFGARNDESLVGFRDSTVDTFSAVCAHASSWLYKCPTWIGILDKNIALMKD